MVVPVCFMVAAWTYALAVTFVPSYRDPADQIGAATIGIENAGDESSRGEPEDKLVKGTA
ncbi:MAG: hypothetical protein Q9228_007983, partial [Teloschistes exilis]